MSTRFDRFPEAQRPGFGEGALVALIAAVSAGCLHWVLAQALRPGPALSMAVAAVGLGYLLYLLGRTRERAGRWAIAVCWLAATAFSFSLYPDPLTQTLVQGAAVWATRSLYFQSSPMGALADLGLILAGIAAALWAGAHTGSLTLAVWSLFLIQALFGSIRVGAGSGSAAPEPVSDPFALAFRSAQAALGRLESNPSRRP